MYFVLSGLIDSLFMQNQLNIFSSSLFIRSLLYTFSFLHNLYNFVEKHKEMINVESSAKQITLKMFETLFRSFMYIKNRSGQRKLPWGTPVLASKKDESVPL